ncbi:MAG: hypothetical protein AB8B94_14255 [Hyphomicrobiales bacterium]
MKICSSRDVDLEPLVVAGKSVLELDTQIRAILQDRPKIARMFAEPIREQGTGETQWMYFGTGELKGTLSQQSEDVRLKIEEKLTDYLAEITAKISDARSQNTPSGDMLADALTAAIEIPDKDKIYVVGNEPVIAGWGNMKGDATKPSTILRDIARKTEQRRTGSTGGPMGGPLGTPPQNPTGPVTGPITPSTSASGLWLRDAVDTRSVQDRWPWMAWVLWALTGLLLFLLLWLYLAHCAFLRTSPATWFANYCPVTTIEQSSRTGLLEDQIDQLEREILRQQQMCVAPPTPITPELPPVLPPVEEEVVPIEPLPEPEVEEVSPTLPATEGERRAEAAGGKLGEVNVILTWDSKDDLDLALNCSNGEVISFSSKQNCGGEHDVDQNVGDTTASGTAVESIVLTSLSPDGEYTVKVRRFRDREPLTDETPFVLEISAIKDGQRIVVDKLEGKIGAKEYETVMRFSLPLEAQ